MKVKKMQHKGYKEFLDAKKRGIKINQYFGQWQYIFSEKKNKISLVRLFHPFTEHWFWEIYCLEGDLFEDVERFITKKKAEIRIKEILGVEK